MSGDMKKLWERNKEEKVSGEVTGLDLFEEEEKETDSCERCGGSGVVIVKGKPSKCGCTNLKKKEEIKEVTEEDLSVKIERLEIPEFFVGREFKPEVLKNNENIELQLRQGGTMDYYIHQLKIIHDFYILDQKLPKSYMIMAPQGHAKNHLVYLSMIEALKRGRTVAPYYDTGDVYKLVQADDTKKLQELLNAEVCFMALEPSFLSNQDTQAVKYVLRKRGKRNLPLVVTSRFNMAYLNQLEPHLQLNLGVKNVEKGDYTKLQEVLAPYPRDYVERYKKYGK